MNSQFRSGAIPSETQAHHATRTEQTSHRQADARLARRELAAARARKKSNR